MHLCAYTDGQTKQRTDHQNLKNVDAGDRMLLVLLSFIIH